MRKLLSFLAAVLACLGVLCLAVPVAQADSFTLYPLGGDNVHLLGIDASGDVLLQQFTSCNGSGGPSNCYEEFTNGVLSYRSDLAPVNFVFENGTACAAPPGLSLSGKSVCDGGYNVAGGSVGSQRGVWETDPGNGTVGEYIYIYFGTADLVDLNSSGDFAVIDGQHDAVYQVMAQTPEPSSWLLLATGAFGLCGVARRRMQAS